MIADRNFKGPVPNLAGELLKSGETFEIVFKDGTMVECSTLLDFGRSKLHVATETGEHIIAEGAVKYYVLSKAEGQKEVEPSELKEDVVNINTAPVVEIVSLPGLGKTLAKRIVAYRREHGPLETVEELMRIEGIGIRKLEGLRNDIAL